MFCTHPVLPGQNCCCGYCTFPTVKAVLVLLPLTPATPILPLVCVRQSLFPHISFRLDFISTVRNYTWKKIPNLEYPLYIRADMKVHIKTLKKEKIQTPSDTRNAVDKSFFCQIPANESYKWDKLSWISFQNSEIQDGYKNTNCWQGLHSLGSENWSNHIGGHQSGEKKYMSLYSTLTLFQIGCIFGAIVTIALIFTYTLYQDDIHESLASLTGGNSTDIDDDHLISIGQAERLLWNI